MKVRKALSLVLFLVVALTLTPSAAAKGGGSTVRAVKFGARNAKSMKGTSKKRQMSQCTALLCRTFVVCLFITVVVAVFPVPAHATDERVVVDKSMLLNQIEVASLGLEVRSLEASAEIAMGTYECKTPDGQTMSLHVVVSPSLGKFYDPDFERIVSEYEKQGRKCRYPECIMVYYGVVPEVPCFSPFENGYTNFGVDRFKSDRNRLAVRGETVTVVKGVHIQVTLSVTDYSLTTEEAKSYKDKIETLASAIEVKVNRVRESNWTVDDNRPLKGEIYGTISGSLENTETLTDVDLGDTRTTKGTIQDMIKQLSNEEREKLSNEERRKLKLERHHLYCELRKIEYREDAWRGFWEDLSFTIDKSLGYHTATCTVWGLTTGTIQLMRGKWEDAIIRFHVCSVKKPTAPSTSLVRH